MSQPFRNIFLCACLAASVFFLAAAASHADPLPAFALDGGTGQAASVPGDVIDSHSLPFDYNDQDAFAEVVFKNVMAGNWGAVIACVVLMLIVALKTFLLGGKWPFWRSAPGVAILTFGLAAAGGAINVLSTEHHFTWLVAARIAMMGLAACGGVLGVLHMIQGRALAVATQAGADAVAASPSQGAVGVVGTPSNAEAPNTAPRPLPAGPPPSDEEIARNILNRKRRDV